MHPPDEVMVKDFLPSVRLVVSKNLRTKGVSQSKIASMLGVTQASVSFYLGSGTAKAYASLGSLGIEQEEADRYSSLIAEDVKRNPVDGVQTLMALWTGMLGRGAVCPRHREMYPSLAECDVCIRQYGGSVGGSAGAAEDVARAVATLEASDQFTKVMPEVSVNVACVVGEAKSPSEVVAIPGRISRVKGRAKALAAPEAGASTHLSRVLLLVRERKPAVRACMNIKYDQRVARILKGLRLKVLELSEYPTKGVPDPTLRALRTKLARTIPSFDVVADRGGEGVEPNLYLLGKNAQDVTGVALRISSLYSAGKG
ncbi:MAG: hypothetical protein HY296_03450 [Thaumarchaeota archaeon]|nr:hypothetical protein [Nitrososphaerota archaeon]